MRRRSRIRRQHEPAELDITSFMNLMVILVPFLLITAVFSRMAILELNLPTADAVVHEQQPEFALEVIVRAEHIEIGDRNAGVFASISTSGIRCCDEQCVFFVVGQTTFHWCRRDVDRGALGVIAGVETGLGDGTHFTQGGSYK